MASARTSSRTSFTSILIRPLGTQIHASTRMRIHSPGTSSSDTVCSINWVLSPYLLHPRPGSFPSCCPDPECGSVFLHGRISRMRLFVAITVVGAAVVATVNFIQLVLSCALICFPSFLLFPGFLGFSFLFFLLGVALDALPLSWSECVPLSAAPCPLFSPFFQHPLSFMGQVPSLIYGYASVRGCSVVVTIHSVNNYWHWWWLSGLLLVVIVLYVLRIRDNSRWPKITKPR